MEKQNEIEIDLLDLLRFLMKKVWIIVAIAVLLGTAGAVFTKNVMEEEFTAETRMYILNQSLGSSIGSISYSDFQVSDKMMQDYLVLMTGKNVTQEVIDTLGLDMTRSELSDKVSVSAIGTSRVLQIVVTDTDPQRAADIANCIREVAGKQIKKIMDVDAVNLVYEAEAPTRKSGPSVMKNTVIATLIGVIVCAGVFVVIYLMDDTIRTEEDVARHMGLSVLGVIPVSSEMGGLAKQASANGRRSKLTDGKRSARNK